MKFDPGAIIALHEPSLVAGVPNTTLCTYDEVKDTLSQDASSDPVVALVQPKKLFVKEVLRSRQESTAPVTIVSIVPEGLSEFEICFRLIDFLDDYRSRLISINHLGTVSETTFPQGSSNKPPVNNSVYAARISSEELPSTSFQLNCKPLYGICDLILPKRVVAESGLQERLRRSESVRTLAVAKRNRCYCLNAPEDMVSLRIVNSKDTLRTQQQLLTVLQPTVQLILVVAYKSARCVTVYHGRILVLLVIAAVPLLLPQLISKLSVMK